MSVLTSQTVFRFGTRSSPLALYQTEKVISALRRLFPEGHFEIRRFQSLGDRDQGTPLETLAKSAPSPSIFADEIEKALKAGEIDAAVHSLKDLSVEDDPELCIAAVPEREDPRDALVTASGESLSRLPKGARIGTCSLRRSLQLLAERPDLRVIPVRGTVEGRLGKMDAGECDGLILAAAGLLRLGLGHRISETFSPERMIPAPGQGALAVQCRRNDAAARELLAGLDDASLRSCVETERQFLKVWQLDYDSPLAAYATQDADGIHLSAAHLDFGKSHKVRRVRLSGADPESLARNAKTEIESGAS